MDVNLDTAWRGCLLVAICGLAIALPDMAYAEWDDVLCSMASFSESNLGRGLATIGVMIVAIGAILGKVSWGLAVTVAVGIAGLFNAPQIAAAIVPMNNVTACSIVN